MHKHIKHSALCLALALPALSGLALAADDDNGQGLQLGIDAGQAQARGICDNVTNCDDTDTTVRADVGWQFNRMVGVELGYTSFGTVFDANEQAPMQVAQVVPGFSEALTRMKKGGQYKITIPAQLGYGDRAVGPIPAGSTLHFDVTLIDFRSEAEVRAMQQMMQQQQMQGAQSGPGGAPPAAPQP